MWEIKDYLRTHLATQTTSHISPTVPDYLNNKKNS